jgi:hypothetical protein
MKLNVASRLVLLIAVAVICALLLTKCGKVDISWTEDVALQDGTFLVVKRTAQGKKLGEIGGSGGWENTQMTLEIESPKVATNPPIWSERWVPMLLDYDAQTKEWFVAATFYTCTDWYDLGRPKLPYIAYRTNGGRWEQIPLNPELYGRKANLLTGPRSGGEPKRVTIEEKRLRSSGTAEKYKKVLDTWSTAC